MHRSPSLHWRPLLPAMLALVCRIRSVLAFGARSAHSTRPFRTPGLHFPIIVAFKTIEVPQRPIFAAVAAAIVMVTVVIAGSLGTYQGMIRTQVFASVLGWGLTEAVVVSPLTVTNAAATIVAPSTSDTTSHVLCGHLFRCFLRWGLKTHTLQHDRPCFGLLEERYSLPFPYSRLDFITICCLAAPQSSYLGNTLGSECT